MKLTDEQRIAVQYEGNVALVACPGSGKTRCIVARLIRSIDLVRNSPQKVACITYTRAAVFEIENRIRVYGASGDEELCEISTIHAFCQNNIFRHFHWRLPAYADGYEVLAPDSDVYLEICNEIIQQFELSGYAKNEFELLNRHPDGTPISTGNIPTDAASAFWSALEDRGYVDFCNLVYQSYVLLREYPSIADYLSCRFPIILVDEFQDTSELQVEILKLIASYERSNFVIVGDPEQSIFGFAGAKPQLMEDFARLVDAQKLPLSGNFRSSQPVIDCAESLIDRNPPMVSVGESKAYVEEPQYLDVESYFVGITEYFLPALEGLNIPIGEAAILAHSFFDLLPLGKALRDYGVPVTGPGARPYKRRHLFAGLAEQLCYYVQAPDPVRVPIIERELFFLTQDMTGRPNYQLYNFHGRCVVFRLLEAARRQREESDGAIAWLENASLAIEQVLVEEGIVPSSAMGLLSESAQEIIADIRSQPNLDAQNMSIADLGVFANPEKNLKLMTMHRSKGREFRAVALISLHDGQIPYFNYYAPLTDEGLDEARRLFYVGITRAERVLYMFTTRQSNRGRSRFLADIGM